MRPRLIFGFVIASLFMHAVTPAFGQMPEVDTLVARYDIYTSYFSPEKLYVHIDRTAYRPGETVWFNAYLSNASSVMLYKPGNFIYVELLRQDGSVLFRVKTKRQGDSFPGCIELNEDVQGGEYTLRAYTLWQMNFSDDYMFHQKIDILGAGKKQQRGDQGRENNPDISFYPEGGRYYAGQPSRIGFKAMDRNGRSMETEGRIVDGDGDEITRVQTRHDGMGIIQFIPDESARYYFETAGGRRIPLPAPSSEGASLSVLRLSGRRMVRVTGAAGGTYSLLLRDSDNLRPVSHFTTDGGVRTFVISEEELGAGINSAILVDGSGKIVSERLLFRYDPSPLTGSISGVDSKFGTREAVTAGVEVKAADGSPVNGSFSVSVLRASLSQCIQNDGIDSYMWLSSELKGALNEPRHYFDTSVPETERAADLDLLMMIQGWRYYELPLIFDPRSALGDYRRPREYMQTVRGKVSRPISSLTPKNYAMLVIVPKLGISRYVNVLEGSSFVMDSLDFEEGTGFMIKVQRKGSTSDYIPTWEGDTFADERRYSPAPGSVSSASRPVEVNFTIEADTLKAAVVVADAVHNDLGVNGRTLPKSDFKEFGNMRLIDYLRMKAPSFTYQDGMMRSNRSTALNSLGIHSSPDMWDESPVQLVVDGAVEPWVGFENITIGELQSISISTQPDIIYRAQEGVVAIRLDYNTRVTHLSDTEPSMLYFTPLGYQVPQKFYAPRYDRGDLLSPGTDRRNTIYWNPSVKLKEGRAEVRFCTSDEMDFPYLIRIEGVTDGGRPFELISECGLL